MQFASRPRAPLPRPTRQPTSHSSPWWCPCSTAPLSSQRHPSVAAETHRRWECIVVDNRSTDGTPDVVEEFAAADPTVSPHACYRARWDLPKPQPSDRGCLPARCVREGPPCGRFARSRLPCAHGCGRGAASRCRSRRCVAAVGGPDLNSLPVDRDVFSGHDIVRQSLTGGPYITGSPTSLLLRTSVVHRGRPFYDESTASTRRRSTRRSSNQTWATSTT